MVKRKLSDGYIAALKPADPGKRRDVYDNQVPGLQVRVTDAGTKSLMLYARWPGRKHFERRLIGKHPAVTIEQARATARGWLDSLRNGDDPRVVAEERRLATLRAQQHTFVQLVDDYVVFIQGEGQRKASVVEHRLRSVFVAAWGERPVASITLHDVREVVVPVVRRCEVSGPQLVRRRPHSVSLGDRDRQLRPHPFAMRSPAAAPADRQEGPQTPVLDNDELRAFWAANARLGDERIDGYPWDPLLRRLLLTGQRKTEISDMQWREIDFNRRMLTIPEERFKSSAVHLVPLPADAMAILTAIPRPKYPKGEFVFSTTIGQKPVDGFSKMKAQLDELMLE